MSDKKDKIDAYLLGQLSEKDKVAFEEDLGNDPEIADELEFRKEVQAGLMAVEREEVRERIRAIAAGEPSARPSRYWQIAASVVLLLGFSLGAWWYLQKDEAITGEDLFAMYFHPEVELDQPRIPDATPTYIDTLNDRYAAKDFVFLLERLEDIPDSASNRNLQMLEAVVLIELRKDEEASQLLSSLGEAIVPEFADEAAWLQALLHLRHDELDLARPILESIAKGNGKLHQAEAKEILEKI